MLTIIIPAFNEEKRILPSLKKIEEYFSKKKLLDEIIIVDDGSTDKTVEKIKALMIKNNYNNIKILKNKKNKGKGYSIRKGILNSKSKYTLFSDSDLSTPIEETEKLLKAMKENDIAIASRKLKESNLPIKQPLHRQIIGNIFPLIVKILLLKEFKDTQCGFKLFRTEVAKKIAKKQIINGFEFDVEILTIARENDIRVKEVPVTWIDKEGSKVSPLKDSFKMLKGILKIKKQKKKGLYRF